MHEKWRNLVFALKTVQVSDALRSRTSSCHGFSLLELVLVLAIIATMAAIAAPRYAASAARYRADSAARRIVADLALARSAAKANSSSRRVKFFVIGDQYRLFDLQPLDGDSSYYNINLSERPYEADIISVDFGTDDQIIFDGWGLPDSGGTVVLTVGSEQRTVVVDGETGKATIQ